MTTGFVRLGPADFAEMAKRLRSMMTPEGAKAWYSHDVSELLTELTYMRQEMDAARDALGANALSEPADNLAELAEQWKAHVSGYWEKEQTKKLRGQIKDLQSELEASKLVLQSAHDHAAESLTERENERQAWLESEGMLFARTQELEAALSALHERHAELGREVLSLRDELKQAEDAKYKDVMATVVEQDTLKAEVRNYLTQALEALG